MANKPSDLKGQLARAVAIALKPKKQIELGSLHLFEYDMLRYAIQCAIKFAVSSADGYAGSLEADEIRERNLWLARASEFRALQARFLKHGRR